jgi:hypothetical protein
MSSPARDDVVMLDRPGRLRLPHEPAARCFIGGDLGAHQLEGDATLELLVLGQQHQPHAALAEHFQHAIVGEPADLVG